MSCDLSQFRDAAPFLRMSDEKKMQIMASQIALAKQIGGPKPVWVPTPENPETGYTLGVLSETNDEVATLVRDDNGEKFKVRAL